MQAVRVGAHVPAKTALSYADQIGARALQLYVGNSRGWARPAGDPKLDEAFALGCAEREIPPFIHASLLVNLGSPTAATVERSIEVLAHGLLRARQIGALGVVFHAGSAVEPSYADTAMKQVREALLPLLDLYDGKGPQLLVEPSAGGGRSLASKVEDLGPYLDAVDQHPGLGVCFDTCHAWAAGHDLAAPGGMTATLDELVSVCGQGRLKLVHANDSKDACGSLRDRHESIGEGTIGQAAFAEMVRHPAIRDVPVIVETPNERHVHDISLLIGLHEGRV